MFQADGVGEAQSRHETERVSEEQIDEDFGVVVVGITGGDGDKDTREQQQKALEFFGVYESVGKDTDEERRDDGGDGGAGVCVADEISHADFKHEAPQAGEPRPPDEEEDEHHRAEV